MKILLGIIGILLALPIAIIIVAAISATLIGGYLWFVIKMFGGVLAAVLILILAVKLIKHLVKSK
jgi:hypothetical protein